MCLNYVVCKVVTYSPNMVILTSWEKWEPAITNTNNQGPMNKKNVTTFLTRLFMFIL